MKIYQFTPPPALTGARDAKASEKTAQPVDFASVLKTASCPRPNAPGQAVSLENQRATHLPSLADMGLAGQLLGFLERGILSATPETLRNVHNLDGLVYVYSKNDQTP
ncbi:MAG: hypothetical protein LBS31_03950 [Candidatus Adiutrix sp.]|jgi:hypothetical protein|nr:hypothetical protein [Candidatus Adiutrix sp.]